MSGRKPRFSARHSGLKVAEMVVSGALAASTNDFTRDISRYQREPVQDHVTVLYFNFGAQLPSAVQTPGGQKCQSRDNLIYYINIIIN
eukprot:SAG11_NODE_29_length_23137_cov_16.739995_18_plen_88_part_00